MDEDEKLYRLHRAMMKLHVQSAIVCPPEKEFAHEYVYLSEHQFQYGQRGSYLFTYIVTCVVKGTA